MEKRFWLFGLMIGFLFLVVGCGGGGGDGGGSTPPPPPEEPAYRIEHQGDVLQVASSVDNQTMRVIIKDKTFQVVSGMLVRVSYAEFSVGELEEGVRVQEITTNAEGVCVFKIPWYDSEGDRTATISLPSFLEIKEVVMTIRYVIDPTVPTRVLIADFNQAEISLALGESVNVVFVVHNAWGNPVAGVETQIIVGQEYASNDFCTTDGNGKSSFLFTAGATSGSTVFRIQVVNYPALMAEIIVSWTGSSPTSIEMMNPSRWDDGVPVAQTLVGDPLDILFLVKDGSGLPAGGVMVMVTFPAAMSDTTDADGIASITIPSSQFPGYDLDKVWVVGNQSIFLDFKIEYLNP